ncbi:uncharacterized protein LOC131179885 [Hevea brasiliensis]|uniref:uncharacterized protein LOC131179885 n=1 Tax=Hevea brasiliensis TaxID=3981 RepID=UPI0025D5511D|nr:uncharacterized protein LOC131179885 [Hevea brasiliensis]
MADNKNVISDVIPMMTKITEHKLNGSNYLEWSKTVRVYLRSIDKDDHLTKDPPTDDTQQTWLREDARLFLQLRNSIHSEVISLINHCEFVKELMDYLDFLYSGKGNISRIYDVCKAFYRAEKENKSLTAYFMDFKRVYEELNVLLPFSSDVKVQQAQREQLAVMSFLAGLPSEYETAKSQILSSSEISSLHETFTRVLRTESTQSSQPASSALISRNPNGQQGNRRGSRGGITGKCIISVMERLVLIRTQEESFVIIVMSLAIQNIIVRNFRGKISDHRWQIWQQRILRYLPLRKLFWYLQRILHSFPSIRHL